ncbi:MAG: hypothetical protein HY897_05705 [Deltaproteobacteria bacterium]|nr:hypothetical protein [Deltaproteobacteria bacterium]
MEVPLAVLLFYTVAALVSGCGGDGGVDDLPFSDGGPAADAGQGLPDAGGGDAGAPDAAAGLWDGLAPVGPRVRDALGVSTHMKQDEGDDPLRDFEFARYAELGGARIREDYHWHRIEPAEGGWHFESVATQAAMARTNGVKALAMLAYGVDWAMPDGTTSGINPGKFGAFAGRVASEFCADIGEYEIWNEPNLSRFWTPGPDPAAYGGFLKAAHGAIKAACPGARVLSGGLSSWDDFDPFSRWGFLSGLHRSHPDICEYFDVLAIHPYTFNQKPSPEHDWRSGGISFESQPAMTALARERLDEMGCPEKPLWFTEAGWPSYELDEPAQGRYLARSALLALRDGVEAYFWYTFWDGEPVTTGERPHENYFGLFGWPGGVDPRRAKPAWLALKGLADVLGNARFSRDLSGDLGLPADIHALAFLRDDGAVVCALWDGRDDPDVANDGADEGGPGTTFDLDLPLPRGAAGYRLLGIDGRELSEGGPAAALRVTLTPEVKYLEIPTTAGR